jgi:uncharacterized protein (DUF433 family)
MSLVLQQDAPPLERDASGAWRIAGTRVLLELVVRAFQDGATPEAIMQRYDTLVLSDVYAVIAYYLRHQEEIDQYLAEREQIAEELRTQIEQSQRDLTDIRQRLKTNSKQPESAS